MMYSRLLTCLLCALALGLASAPASPDTFFVPESDYSVYWTNPAGGENADIVDEHDGDESFDHLSTTTEHPAWCYDTYWADGSAAGGSNMQMQAWLKGLGPLASTGDFRAEYKYGGEWHIGIEVSVPLYGPLGWREYTSGSLDKVAPNQIRIRGHKNQAQGSLGCDEVQLRYY
jgi:hypothetical protein